MKWFHKHGVYRYIKGNDSGYDKKSDARNKNGSDTNACIET